MTPSIPDSQLEQFINDSGWEPERLGRKQSLIPSSYLQEAVQVYESMNELDDLVTEDNLVIASTDCEGSARVPDLIVDDNIIYTLFQHTLGKRKDALNTEEAINKKFLASPYTLARGLFDSSSIVSSENALLGILYEEMGHRDTAIKVYETMHHLKLVRDDNLVWTYRSIIEERYGDELFSYDNCLWGLFLNRLGKEDEARIVLQSMEDTGMIRDDGPLGCYAKTESKEGDNDVSTVINAAYGMFLKALGEDEKAKGLMSAMKSLGLHRKDGHVKAMHTQDAEIQKLPTHPKNNIYYGLFLQSMGDDDGWQNIHSVLKKQDDLWREDGLIKVSKAGYGRPGDVSSFTNCLYGLFLMQGHHVFTGDSG